MSHDFASDLRRFPCFLTVAEISRHLFLDKKKHCTKFGQSDNMGVLRYSSRGKILERDLFLWLREKKLCDYSFGGNALFHDRFLSGSIT